MVTGRICHGHDARWSCASVAVTESGLCEKHARRLIAQYTEEARGHARASQREQAKAQALAAELLPDDQTPAATAAPRSVLRALDAFKDLLREELSDEEDLRDALRDVDHARADVEAMASRLAELEDRVTTIVNEEVGIQPVTPVDELLTLLERHHGEQRKEIHESKTRLSVLVLLRRNGLVVGSARKDDPNDFGLPGGKVEPTDASPRSAAARELLEETGIEVHPENLVEVFGDTDERRYSITYEATEWCGGPRQQPGEGACDWVTWEQLEAGCFGSYNARLRAHLEKPQPHSARPKDDWNEEDGNCLWWFFPIAEPPYCGSPLDENFPDYVTHWTRIQVPAEAP